MNQTTTLVRIGEDQAQISFVPCGADDFRVPASEVALISARSARTAVFPVQGVSIWDHVVSERHGAKSRQVADGGVARLRDFRAFLAPALFNASELFLGTRPLKQF